MGLFQILVEKLLDRVKGDHGRIIVQVDMHRAGHDQILLVVALHLCKGVVAVKLVVGLFAVKEQHCAVQFAQIVQDRGVDEAQRIGDRGAAVGIEAACLC